MIDPRVEPRGFTRAGDGQIAVEAHQAVRDTGGKLISDQLVVHVYTLADGLITGMDVRQPETGGKSARS